jgi:hypothetical protein
LFRRELEAAVMEARGEITLTDAAFINTAYRAERHAQLAQRWLAIEAESMEPADRLSYSREVVRASESRDKAIAALSLPKRDGGDYWASLRNGNGRCDTSVQNGAGVQKPFDPDNAPQGECGADSDG